MVIFDVADIATRPKAGWPKVLFNGVDVTNRIVMIDTEKRMVKWHILDEKGKYHGQMEEIEIPKSVKIEIIYANQS